MIGDATLKVVCSIKTFSESLDSLTEEFNKLSPFKSHTTINKRGKIRTWWLPYGTYVPCHVCQTKIIPVEEVWCGCKPVPRKMKKWCKGRRAVYKETMAN